MFNSSSEFQERVRDKKKRRWQLFRATDFQSLMYPCFILCRILGIFPYKINTSSYEISKLYYILSIVIKCVTCLFSLIMFYVLNTHEWFKTQNIRRIIAIDVVYILGLFIIIITYILDGPRIRLLQTMRRISSRLSSESYQRQSILIHIKDISGFFYSLVLILICISYNYEFSIFQIFQILSLYSTLIAFQMDMLYMNCVCVLKACFKKINDDLAKLLVINNKPYLFRRFYHEQKNVFLLMELKALKKYHLMVNNTVQILNMTFSPQLLATITLTFIKITFCLYFYINGKLWKDILYLSKYFDILLSDTFYIMSIVYYFIKMALIIWACQTGKDQAVEIRITIHDVCNSTADEEIKTEVIKKMVI